MKNPIALKTLVGNVARTILPNTVNRCSFFVNDIAPGIQVHEQQDNNKASSKIFSNPGIKISNCLQQLNCFT